MDSKKFAQRAFNTIWWIVFVTVLLDVFLIRFNIMHNLDGAADRASWLGVGAMMKAIWLWVSFMKDREDRKKG